MSGLNQAQIIGNVGKEPELKRLPSGARMASFSLATSEQWTDKNSGEKKERTEWHHVVVFGPPNGDDGLVGVVEKYVRKGSKLFVQGPLRTRSWEQDGVKRYTTEIVLQGFGASMQLLGSATGKPGPASEDDYGKTRTSEFGRSTTRSEMDDEIPFGPEYR